MALSVNAALKFAETVKARREILEGLLQAVYDGSRRSWVYYEKLKPLSGLDALYENDPNYPVVRSLEDARAIAEATAQDAALALMLITDYAIRRYGREAKAEDSAFTDTRKIGALVRNGVTFNKAVWALANQARHFERWIALGDKGCLTDPHVCENYKTIQLLECEPLKLNAAREFIAGTNGLYVKSYAEYEALVLSSIPAAIVAQAGISVLP